MAGVQDPSLAYQGLNPHPLYRECRVLSTGPTKEVSSVKFKSVSLEWVLVYLICTSYYWCNSYFTICFPKLRTSRGPGNNIDLLLLLKDKRRGLFEAIILLKLIRILLFHIQKGWQTLTLPCLKKRKKMLFKLYWMAFLFLLGLTGIMLYRHLKDYLLTEEQLRENNYPQPNPEKPGSILLNPGMTKTRVNDPKYMDLKITLSVYWDWSHKSPSVLIFSDEHKNCGQHH